VMRRYVMYVDPALCSIRIAVEPVKKDDEYHFEYDYDYDHELLSLLCLSFSLKMLTYTTVSCYIYFNIYIYLYTYHPYIYAHIHIYTHMCAYVRSRSSKIVSSSMCVVIAMKVEGVCVDAVVE